LITNSVKQSFFIHHLNFNVMNLTKNAQTRQMPTTLEEHHHMLVEKARSAGKKLAITNLPSLQSDEKLEGYIQSIRSGYSGLLAQEQKRNPVNQSDIAEIESKSTEQKYEKLSERYTELKNRLRHEQLEYSEMDDTDARLKNTIPLWAASIFLGLLESLFSYRAFTMLDLGNNITVLILIIGLTVAFVALPKKLRWWYEEFTVDSKFKWVLNIGILLVLGGVFYVFGILRSSYLMAQGDFTVDGVTSTPFVVTPIYFCGINVFLLLIGYYIAHQYPSSRQLDSQAALAKKEKTIAKLESDLGRMERELSAMPEREKQIQIKTSNTNTGRRDTYVQVNNFFKEAIGAFIEVNCTYRSDGQRPRCFDEPVMDLENLFI